MPDDPRIEEQVKEMIVERLFLDIEPASIADDDVLMDTLDVDSIKLLEIVVGIQEAFEFEIEDDEFSPERFETVAAIADFVREKTQGAQG
jgi:acyl carrier protein